MPTKAFCVIGKSRQFVLPGAGDVWDALQVCEDKDGTKGLYCRAVMDTKKDTIVAQCVALTPIQGGVFEKDLLEAVNLDLPCFYCDNACFPFVLSESGCVVKKVALMLKANCSFIQNKRKRVPAFFGSAIETAMKPGGHNVNFVKSSSLPIEEVVKDITISEQVKELGELHVYNIKTMRAVKEGEALKLYYSKEFAKKIRSDIKVIDKNDKSLEACAYDSHRPPHWFKRKGCERKFVISKLRAHLNNWKNSEKCYKAVFGKLPLRRGDV